MESCLNVLFSVNLTQIKSTSFKKTEIMYKILLTRTSEESLFDFIQQLHVEEIDQFFDNAIFYRGENYFNQHLIKNVRFEGKNKLAAIIRGTRDYKTHIIFEKDKNTSSAIYCQCSCPYEYGTCKHAVALLLYAKNYNVEIKYPSKIETNKITNWLQNKSNEELINIILEIAPDNFFDKLNAKLASKSEVERIFTDTVEKIDELFEEEDLLYSPEDFNNELITLLDKLRGLWQKKEPQIKELLFDIIKNIDNAFDNGYLYIDDHHEEEFFEPYLLDKYIVDFARELSTNNKINFIQEYEKIYQNLSYNSTAGIIKELPEIVIEKDLSLLKDVFISNQENYLGETFVIYYRLIEKLLSDREKEYCLKRNFTSSAEITLDLINFYIKRERNKDAIKILKLFIEARKDSLVIIPEIYEKYLNLAQKAGQSIYGIAQEALSKFSTRKMLKTVISYLPDRKANFEKQLEKAFPEEILKYYEAEKRYEDAIKIVDSEKISVYAAYCFYVKYKELFKEKAEVFFLDTITKNLEQTGEKHYARIVEALKLLYEINRTKAKETEAILRTDYKKRIHFIEMLNELRK